VSKSGLDLSQVSGFTVVAEKLNFFRYISHFRCVSCYNMYYDTCYVTCHMPRMMQLRMKTSAAFVHYHDVMAATKPGAHPPHGAAPYFRCLDQDMCTSAAVPSGAAVGVCVRLTTGVLTHGRLQHPLQPATNCTDHIVFTLFHLWVCLALSSARDIMSRSHSSTHSAHCVHSALAQVWHIGSPMFSRSSPAQVCAPRLVLC
jgi:hypothetical protein